MKTSQNGFIAPLILVIIALFLAGGGAYGYRQMKFVSQPTVENMELPQATSTGTSMQGGISATKAVSTAPAQSATVSAKTANAINLHPTP